MKKKIVFVIDDYDIDTNENLKLVFAKIDEQEQNTRLKYNNFIRLDQENNNLNANYPITLEQNKLFVAFFPNTTLLRIENNNLLSPAIVNFYFPFQYPSFTSYYVATNYFITFEIHYLAVLQADRDIHIRKSHFPAQDVTSIYINALKQIIFVYNTETKKYEAHTLKELFEHHCE